MFPLLEIQYDRFEYLAYFSQQLHHAFYEPFDQIHWVADDDVYVRRGFVVVMIPSW